MDRKTDLLADFIERLNLFNKMAEKNQRLFQGFEKFDDLVRWHIIKRFATKKLAEQLGCVECEEPREKTDWYTAENFFNSKFTDVQWLSLGRRDLILRAYDCLRKKKELPDISQAVINNFGEGFADLISIMETLLILPDDELSELMLEASQSEDRMNVYLGRLIWQWGYQQIKRDLPRPPYGRINFD